MGLHDLNIENLTLRVEPDLSEQAPCIRVTWLGKADMRQPSSQLGPYFQELTAEAANRRKYLEFHFERLDHFNSATILLIMQLIQNLRRQSIRLRIVFNGGLKWQRMTFEALRQLDRRDGLLELTGQEIQ